MNVRVRELLKGIDEMDPCVRPVRTRRRPLVVAAVLCAAAAAGGGCSGAASTGEAGTGPSGRLPAYDVNPTPRERVRSGGTLRWPLPEFPTQWNFFHVNGGTGVVDRVVQGLLPYLMRADEKAVPHPVPDYLLSARATRTGANQVVTYRMNPRARWSDGRPIGYRDLAAQAHALSGRDPRYQVSTDVGYRQIRRVERGADDQEVRVTFAGTYADWRSLFSPLYPAAATSDPAAFNTGWLDRMPVTAGPFKVQRIDRTAETVTAVRDPAWWGRAAKLDRIVYRALDSGAVPGAFANGEIDLMDVGVDAGALRRAERAPGTVVRRAGGPDWRHFTFNAAGPVLSDVRVRRAVMLGIDRRTLVRSDLTGLGLTAEPLGNHFYVNTQEGYRDNSGEYGGYDPARARRMLDEAGWPPHGRYREKGGRTLALRFVVPAGVPGGKREGELSRALLERIGVRLDIRPVPGDDLLARYVTPGDFDIVPFSWLGTSFPVSPLRSVFARPSGGRIRQNYSRSGTAAIDAALDRAIAEPDPVRARRLVNAADGLIWRHATVLPLYQRPQLVATRRGLANLGACGFYQPGYENIGFTRG
ncbi:ABC transporter family substrate-binding protein [Actinomadura xylanilytica]|uniref:ABC transporter family substrate-binding protein n=1 Tax=Actinomadura xylanilytica TaxID=887459 RepID=UPI00255B2C93|nr:ABC transporter family substrate-binding protein [Actinomadura xylanilytica]MDL4771419.1 ABC transporter family substrate-binding protein [Actinomadura xylanilytica]